MSVPNYPDILGMITGGSRCVVDAVQVAIATRPRVARVGRPFEVIMLVQSMVDTDVDVTMTLHLPTTDAKKQRDRFVTKAQRLIVGIKPAEVGYVMLPASTLPDTAVGEYVIEVETGVKTIGRGGRVRFPDGGGRVELSALSEEAHEQIEMLKELTYFTTKKRLGSVIEVPFSLLSGGLGKVTDFSPGWFSLCRLSDYGDARPMLRQYAEQIQLETLPPLKRAQLFQPLLETTRKRFESAGFPLREVEAISITKLLTLILEYATPKQNAHGHIAARTYNIMAMVERDPLDMEAAPGLPHWFRQFMTYAEDDPRAFSRPAQVILGYLYEDLVGDAVDYAFALVEEATGENLGDEKEMFQYRERVMNALRDAAGMDFSLAYLPLIMGGMIISEQMPLEGEHPSETVKQLGKSVQDRIFDSRDDERPVFDLANQLLAQIGQKHGYRPPQ